VTPPGKPEIVGDAYWIQRKTPAKRPSKDSRGSYAEYSALGMPRIFLDFFIGHRCQVIGNFYAIRRIHVVDAPST
jgi:hypothetical protein